MSSCSKVWCFKSAGFLSGFAPASKAGLHTGKKSSVSNFSAIRPGH